MNESYIIKFISIILSTIITDIAWTYYFIKVNEKKSIESGVWASAIILSGAFTTISYVNDLTFLVAAIIGSFIGTVLSVEYKKYSDKIREENVSM